MAGAISGAQLVFLDDDGDLYGYPRDCRQMIAHIDRFIAALGLRGDLAPEGPANDGMARLTPREIEVLQQIAQGRTNHEIASQLVLSERTVARHITNLYAKLGVRSKAEATAFAIHNGLS
jgi:DNA-binding NarL/FixJ family response regulator